MLAPTAIEAGQYNAKQTRLENGLTVIAINIPRAPIITQQLFYKVGGMDDPPGKSGLAHLLEHMMFKGTKAYPDNSFSQQISQIGGQDNAFTSQDFTGYYQTLPSEHIGLAMKLEADRMRNLNFDDTEFINSFAIERNVVIEERAQRTDNNPSARLQEQRDPAFYLNHPYRKPIIGWPGELEGLQIKDAEEFYNRYYHPNNAILIIAGDVEAQKVFSLAQKYYGKIAKGPEIHRPDYGTARLTSQIDVIYEDELVQLPQWIRLYPASSYGEIYNEYGEIKAKAMRELVALSLGIDMIAGGQSSPLYKSLVLDQKKALQVGVFSNFQRRGPGFVGMYFIPPNGTEDTGTQNHQSMKDIVNSFEDVLKNIIHQGISPSRFERVIKAKIDEAEFALDGLEGPARHIGSLMMLGFELDMIDDYTNLLRDITLGEINQALRTFFDQKGRVDSYLLTP